MPDSRGFSTKAELKARAARLSAEADAYARAAVFASGGDTGMNSEIRTQARKEFFRKRAARGDYS